jgi:hypothetical protein
VTADLAQASPPEVARIVAHLSCLEAAAADPAADPETRKKLREQIARDRTALALLGADVGQARTTPDNLGEAGRGC